MSGRWLLAAAISISSLALPAVATEQSADKVQLTADVNRPTARVAEPIEFLLQITAPRGTDVRLPDPPSIDAGPFVVRSHELRNDLPVPGRPESRQWSIKLVFESITPGAGQIPALEVQYRRPNDDSWQSVRTSAVDVEIVSLLDEGADPTDFRDIKPAVELPSSADRSFSAWRWAALGAAVLAILALIVWRARRPRGVPAPRELALDAITQIESLHQSAAIRTEQVYGELSLILRELIESTYGFPAATTMADELHRWLDADAPIGSADAAILIELLQQADNVRFARLSQDRQEVGQAIDRARSLVQAWPPAGCGAQGAAA